MGIHLFTRDRYVAPLFAVYSAARRHGRPRRGWHTSRIEYTAGRGQLGPSLRGPVSPWRTHDAGWWDAHCILPPLVEHPQGTGGSPLSAARLPGRGPAHSGHIDNCGPAPPRLTVTHWPKRRARGPRAPGQTLPSDQTPLSDTKNPHPQQPSGPCRCGIWPAPCAQGAYVCSVRREAVGGCGSALADRMARHHPGNRPPHPRDAAGAAVRFGAPRRRAG